MLSFTLKKPAFSKTEPAIPGSTSLPPLHSLFGTKSPSFSSSLPAIHDILAPQTPRRIHSYPSALSLTSYSLSATNLERPAPVRSAASFPAESPSAPAKSPSSAPNTTKVATLLQVKEGEAPFSETAAKMASKIKSNASPRRDFAFISYSPATFPSQEPAIDNASLARRKRRRTSPNELAILNHEFCSGSTPGKSKRLEISKKVNMTEKAVQIWFQNKRQSVRRLRACEKDVMELPPTPDTTINSSYSMDTCSDMSTEMPHSQPILPTLNSPYILHILALLSPFRSGVSNQKPEIYDKKPCFILPVSSGSLKSDKGASVKQEPVSSLEKERKPLAAIDTNIPLSFKAGNPNDVQCIQGLLSLRTAAH